MNIRNKGTGAGGSNTNKSGLAYEKTTYLPSLISIDSTKYIHLMKSKLKKHLINHINSECKHFLQPDECLIDICNKRIIIFEKKCQNRSGSVDEKIQSGPIKRDLYEYQYPSYKIIYAYVLNDWFKQEKYKKIISLLNDKYNIPVLWGDDNNYVNQVMNLLSIPP